MSQELAGARIGPGVAGGDDALALDGASKYAGASCAMQHGSRLVLDRRRGDTCPTQRMAERSLVEPPHAQALDVAAPRRRSARMLRSRSSNRSFGSVYRVVRLVSASLCAASRRSLALSAVSAASCSLMS